ncbi:MAG: hypothetical protein ABI591_11690 [Kofleriaceae bacterium]
MSEIYRDRSEGTAAKRQELLRRRREELVTMPHAVRRVVVARTARIAASLVATLAGVALLATAYSPSLATRLSSVMPGIQPAPLSTLLSGAWLLGLVAWAISRARVEHRFAVAMSKYVLPTNDLDHDVERLDHEHPDDIARTMGHQLEVRSAAWPVLAAGVVLPATALWFAQMLRTHGWPVMSEYEVSLALHAKMLVLIGVAGALAAITMTRKTMRRPFIAMTVLPFGLLASGLTVVGSMKSASYAWVLCGLGVVTVSIGLVARALRKERALLEVEDPAAGSELFTIRGMLRQLRESVVAAKQAMSFVKRKYWLVGGTLTAIALIAAGANMIVKARHQAAAATAYLAANPPQVWQRNVLTPTTTKTAVLAPYKIERVGNRFRVEATLNDKGEMIVPMIGFATVPESWSATLDIQLISGGSLGIVSDDGVIKNIDPATTAHLVVDACRGSRPLAVSLQQPASAHEKVAFYVSPKLEVASCP